MRRIMGSGVTSITCPKIATTLIIQGKTRNCYSSSYTVYYSKKLNVQFRRQIISNTAYYVNARTSLLEPRRESMLGRQ